MRWTEARVLAPEGWLELVAEALSLAPCGGAAFGRPSLATDAAPEGRDFVRVFIPDRMDSPALRAALEREVAGLSERTGAPELVGLRIEFRALPPEDYATSWRKSWKPFRVGRLCVLLPGSTRALREGDLPLQLEPGGAFGSGRHVTTRECLRVAQERVSPGESVLDAGSGSGILSVAAVLLGAEDALGFDIDPDAKPYADALARDNGVAARCEFRTGGFEVMAPADGRFDAVLANLCADVIGAGVSRLTLALRPGGWFVFSGCAEPRAALLRETLSGSGLCVEEERVCGRWHTFVGSRSKGSPDLHPRREPRMIP